MKRSLRHRFRDLRALALTILALCVACGGSATDSVGNEEGSGGTSAGDGADPGAGASDGAGSGGLSDGGGGRSSGGQTFDDDCDELHVAAGNEFYEVHWSEGLACTLDEECQWVTGLGACFDPCFVLSGAETEGIREAVDEVCEEARAEGCPEDPRPCLAVDDELQCVDGVCGGYLE